jgi:PAS domain S-box-containing protein
LGPHDHLCSIYGDEQEHYRVVAPFLRIGLDRGEKCIYVADDGTENIIREALEAEGIDVDLALATNALVLSTAEQVYLRQGNFDPDRMLAFWSDATHIAMNQGFAALRAADDSRWVVNGAVRHEHWIEYESRLTGTLAEINCLVLCSYDRRQSSPELILDVIRTHPTVAYGGTVSQNSHHLPAERFVGTNRVEREVEKLLHDILTSDQARSTSGHQRNHLRESEQRANEKVAIILDSMPDNLFGFDKEWKYTYFNEHAAEQLKLLGKDPAGLIGKSMWDEFPYVPNEQALRRAMIERVVTTDELYYPPLGEWVENHMYPSHDGGLVIYQRYVTERKRAEEDLRRSEANLAEGQRISHTGSWAWTAISGALFWSVEHFRIFGLDPEVEASTEVGFQLLHPEDRTLVENTFYDAVREKTDFEVEYRIVRPDGTVRHLSSVGHPILNNSGDLAEFVGTVLDITDRKHVEDALRVRDTELARASRALTIAELTASIAHEVNQPLSAVIANSNAGARWLAADPPNIDEARMALRRIVRDGKRASQVVERIRALLKKGGTNNEHLDMNLVVHDVVELTRGALRRNSISLELVLEDELPAVWGDRVQLQQVLLNLIINGIEAMSGLVDRPSVLIVSSQTDDLDHLRVSVEDTGVGLGSENLEQVFAAFYTTKSDGIGVGLSISRSIIEAHGGRLWAAQNRGPGASFQFSLPVCHPEPVARPEAG